VTTSIKATPPNTQITPVLLAGGKGSRLSPLTSSTRPKSLIKFFSRHSFLQKTLLRVPNLAPPIIICEEQQIEPITKQLREIDIQSARFIAEPNGLGRSTAPAIALAAQMALDEILLVLPCDQAIKNEDLFEGRITTAAVIDLSDKLLLFGITPHKPSTRYGYIEAHYGDLTIDVVKGFKEKPDKKTAAAYTKDGRHLWNTGIFLSKATHIMSELQHHQPEMMQTLEHAIHKLEGNTLHLVRDEFARIEPLSIDHALMEKTTSAYVTNLGLKWTDTGTWPSLLLSKFGIF